jgi:hypothetical protein
MMQARLPVFSCLKNALAIKNFCINFVQHFLWPCICVDHSPEGYDGRLMNMLSIALNLAIVDEQLCGALSPIQRTAVLQTSESLGSSM